MASRAANGMTKTSATGNKLPAYCLPAEAGFTLIEMVIVIAIMSIMLGIAIHTIGNGRERFWARQESDKLFHILRLSSENATLTGRQIEVHILPDGYNFTYFDEKSTQWLPLEEAPFTAYQLPAPLHLELSSTPIVLPHEEATNHSRPTILLLSSGETSIFRIALFAGNDKTPFRIITSDGHTGLRMEEESKSYAR